LKSAVSLAIIRAIPGQFMATAVESAP